MGDEDLKQELIDQRKKELEIEALEDKQEQIRETRVFHQYFYNAVIMAGITFLSTMKIDFPPTMDNLWAAFIAGGLALLMQLKSYYNIQEARDAGLADQTKPKKPPLGMLIW